MLDQEILALSDRQVFAILGNLSGEFSSDALPQEARDKSNALEALLQTATNTTVSLQNTIADSPQAAQVGREILQRMRHSAEMGASVEEWLQEPPVQEAAALVDPISATLVISGCLAFLHVVGHVSFQRDTEGKWNFAYNPDKESPLDKNVGKFLDILSKLFGK